MNIEPSISFGTPKAFTPNGITLTEPAAACIKEQISIRRKGIGIRFGVTGAGCGGYSYTIAFVDEDFDEDFIFKDHDIDIFVDKKSILLIDGMEVDFVNKGFKSGFEFKNPLAGQSCGCGESFSIA